MQRKLIWRFSSYALDWLIIICAVFIFQRIGDIAGHRQHFSLTDIRIKYEYTGPSTIPNYANVMLSVVFPALTILVLLTVLERRLASHRTQQSGFMVLYTINTSLLGLALSVSLSQVFTNALKVTIGRPRPDLLARCMPTTTAVDPVPYGLSTSAICTQTNAAILNDGFRSFPSGHSSMAFSGLAYLTLFLAWRLSLFNKKGQTWKWTVVMLPFLIASLVAISRIKDNRHHPFDVLFGSGLGIVTSFIAFFQYHPELTRVHNRFPVRFKENSRQTSMADDPETNVDDVPEEQPHRDIELQRYGSSNSQRSDWSAEQDIVPPGVSGSPEASSRRPLVGAR
ncbi:protein of unknown function [Taphrina deformans PYCC 5710]|uniref:Phosphatidic acid phosphatase type 2/haloperoxidase domain-containing protein n=1 Tax=Taphrina deformans (strain PYCC 5710 / ATCC 11124 / CBS 356.35 / IMI 108563 / JCM 9778 / NBRC 8474) TaxID=1097556 RepID=R4XHS7_TAPDE|nr:protein of unknown function [Taphrina deformans PYCC 5710]|eukprot:CCG84068.1 protein of unknown function [Taphrina deformans PYCC 5710]